MFVAARWLLAWLLGVALLPVVAGAQTAAAPAEAQDPSRALVRPIYGPDHIKAAWKLRRQAVEAGDEARADELFRQVVGLCRDNGIRHLDALSFALLREARGAAAAASGDRARALLEQARTLSPDLPETHLTEASLALKAQPFAIHKWFVQRVNAFFAQINDFQRRVLLVGDATITAMLVLSVLACVFLLAQLFRHGLSLYYGLGDLFPVVTKLLVLASVVILALIPLFYGFGPYVLFFPAMILLWSYQSPTERALSVAFTVLLGAAPWMLRMTDRLSEAGTGVPQALHRLTRDPADPRAVVQVEAAVAASPQDWEARVVLALAHKRQSRLEPAEKLLHEAQAIVAGQGEAEGIVANNLGNVRFAMGRLQSAERAYQQAVAALPNAVEPVFNLHRLYQRQTRLGESNEQMSKASALAPERVATWNEDAEPNLNRYVVDLELPADQLTRRAFSDLFSPTPLAARLWQVAAGPVPEMAAPLFAAITILLFGVLRAAQSRLRVTRPCSRCAHPAPVRLADEGEGGRLCEPCTNLFVRNLPVDRRIRYQKEVAIGRLQLALRWGTRIAGLLLPGLAGLMRGRPLRGALLLALAILLALRLLLPHGLLLEPAPATLPTHAQNWTLLGGLGVLWLVSAVRAFQITRGEV